MTTLPAPDRLSDHIDANPHWNESAWFSLNKPDEKINGIIHYYFRPNMGLLNGGPILWQPGENRFDNCLFYNWAHLQAAPAGAEKYAMTAANSLSVKVLKPLTRYAIGYDDATLVMDLVWEAIGPVHEFSTGHATQEKTARYHLEQPGTMKGTLVLHGREIAIDCLSMRDASSGPREYGKVASGSYFWGVAADRCFHAIVMGEGPDRALMGGYIWQDGVMADLVSGRRVALDYGRYGPSRVRFEAVDTLGRTVAIDGRVEQGLIHTGYTTHTVVWSLVEWTWDGVVHWGEHQEFQSAEKFRKIARGELPLGV